MMLLFLVNSKDLFISMILRISSTTMTTTTSMVMRRYCVHFRE